MQIIVLYLHNLQPSYVEYSMETDKLIFNELENF